MSTPMHLRPEACFICGDLKRQHHSGSRHTFVSNAEAERVLSQRHHIDWSPEAAYVAEHRPY